MCVRAAPVHYVMLESVCHQDWIYAQICVCAPPLHPLLPQLIEAYVNSILVKSNKTDHTNMPIPASDITQLFTDHPVFSKVTKFNISKVQCICKIFDRTIKFVLKML